MNWFTKLLGVSGSRTASPKQRASSGSVSAHNANQKQLTHVRLPSIHGVIKPFGNPVRFQGEFLHYELFPARSDLDRYFQMLKEHASRNPPPQIIEAICGKLSDANRVAHHYKQPYAIITPLFGDAVPEARSWYLHAIRAVNEATNSGMRADGGDAIASVLSHVEEVYEWIALVPSDLAGDIERLETVLADDSQSSLAAPPKWNDLIRTLTDTSLRSNANDVRRPPTPFSMSNLAYYRDADSGVSFAYPDGWVSGRIPSGAFVMHRQNPAQLASGIVDLGMTLMQYTFKNSPFGTLDDAALCAAYVDNVTTQGRTKTLLWRTTGSTATGFPTTTFCYHYESGSDQMSAIANVAAAYKEIHHLDVTGLRPLVDDHADSWKALLHKLDIERL